MCKTNEEKIRLFWFCCECGDGPLGIGNIPACVHCHHIQCALCNIVDRKVEFRSASAGARSTKASFVPTQTVSTTKRKGHSIKSEPLPERSTPTSSPKSGVDLVKSRHYPDKSETNSGKSESVTSLPESTVESTATKSNIELFRAGAEQVLPIFYNDSQLQELLFTASRVLTKKRFSRNLTRILIQYSHELLLEAESHIQQDAAIFLGLQARHVSKLVVQAYSLIPGDSSDVRTAQGNYPNQYLAGYQPKLDPEVQGSGDEDEEADSQSDTDLEDNDFIIVAENHELQQFLTSGLAFQNFRGQFRDFLYSNERLERHRISKGAAAEAQQNSSRIRYPLKLLDVLVNAIQLLNRQENIPQGYKRLIYQCHCGYTGYDDYLESKEGALKDFERDLKESGLFTYVSILDQARDRAAAFLTTTVSNIIYGVKNMMKMITTLPKIGPPLPVINDTYDQRSLDCPPQNKCKHIHLCRQRGPSTVPWLEHFHVCYSGETQENRDLHANYDTIFFRELRKSFSKSRSFGEKLLFRLKQIDFVKFEVLPLCSAECRDRPSLPPSQADYEFSPAADGLLPPIGPQLMMHLFHGHHPLLHQSTLFYDRLPKKRGPPLQYSALPKETNIGWGLDFVMVFNLRLIILLAFIFDVVVCLIFACIWSRLERDTQDAFTIAGWISATLSIGVATLQSWMT